MTISIMDYLAEEEKELLEKDYKSLQTLEEKNNYLTAKLKLVEHEYVQREKHFQERIDKELFENEVAVAATEYMERFAEDKVKLQQLVARTDAICGEFQFINDKQNIIIKAYEDKLIELGEEIERYDPLTAEQVIMKVIKPDSGIDIDAVVQGELEKE